MKPSLRDRSQTLEFENVFGISAVHATSFNIPESPVRTRKKCNVAPRHFCLRRGGSPDLLLKEARNSKPARLGVSCRSLRGGLTSLHGEQCCLAGPHLGPVKPRGSSPRSSRSLALLLSLGFEAPCFGSPAFKSWETCPLCSPRGTETKIFNFHNFD
jgi:hypothetical protein